MSVTLRAVIIAALLTAAAAVLYHYSTLTGQLTPDEISQRYPTFTASGFTAEVFDRQGRPTHSIRSQDISYYRVRDLVLASNLSGIFYENRGGGRYWRLKAGAGELVLNRYAVLTGGVSMTPGYPDAPIESVTTGSVYLDIPGSLIRSNSYITIKGSSFVNRGSGFEVDLSRKTFVIKEHPHATYYPPSSSARLEVQDGGGADGGVAASGRG